MHRKIKFIMLKNYDAMILETKTMFWNGTVNELKSNLNCPGP